MKLKILPTHLRDKKRYLAFEAFSEIPLEREDVISLVLDASGDLYGAFGTSKMGLWVLKVWNCPSLGKNVIKGIIRCNREEIDATRALIPTITRFRGKKVVFQTLGISGTIKAATTNFIKLKAADE
jgi:ribonuclease P/MRP protein subunit POP5